MRATVKLRKGQLEYFRRLARNSPKEIFAFLVGIIVSPGLVRVEQFVYSEYKEQTTGSVTPTTKAQKEISHWVIDEGLQVVGSIHSHPEWDAVLSPTDHKSHISDGHRISGVVSIVNHKTRARFWLAESSLPCKIVYIEKE